MAYGKKAPSCDPLTFWNDEIKVFMNTENIEVSQYVKLSHLTQFLSVRWHTRTKVTHFSPQCVISRSQKKKKKKKNWVKMTQFYILTHFDVFCEEN